MTENETTLLDMIRGNKNPEQALLVAVEIITDFLNHRELSELKSSVDSQESA